MVFMKLKNLMNEKHFIEIQQNNRQKKIIILEAPANKRRGIQTKSVFSKVCKSQQNSLILEKLKIQIKKQQKQFFITYFSFQYQGIVREKSLREDQAQDLIRTKIKYLNNNFEKPKLIPLKLKNYSYYALSSRIMDRYERNQKNDRYQKTPLPMLKIQLPNRKELIQLSLWLQQIKQITTSLNQLNQGETKIENQQIVFRLNDFSANLMTIFLNYKVYIGRGNNSHILKGFQRFQFQIVNFRHNQNQKSTSKANSIKQTALFSKKLYL